MEKLGTLVRNFHDDQSGAAFVEYTVLIGLVLVLSIAIIGAVGLSANNQWTALNTAVNP